MLVLSRKCAESVVLGCSNGITQLARVTVLEISPGRVRLGFEAGKDVPVFREEVWELKRAKGLREGATGGLDDSPASETGTSEKLSGGGKCARGPVGAHQVVGSGSPVRVMQSRMMPSVDLERWENEGGGPNRLTAQCAAP